MITYSALKTSESRQSATLYVGDYYPRHRYRRSDRFSYLLRQLKHQTQESIEYFAELLMPHMPAGWSIAVVPSHREGNHETGIGALARQLTKRCDLLDATACLVRIIGIPKQAFGGYRSEYTHLISISVDRKELIENKQVILLDDIVTSGCSMRACKTLLLAAGAEQVQCIAIGKTMDRFAWLG